LGRRDRQHGRTARADGGSRGGSAPATAGARPGQQEARAGPIGSRGGARTVARPWEEGGVQLDGGGTDGAMGGGVGTRRGKTRGFYRGKASPVMLR
jgi:hypothetical protein